MLDLPRECKPIRWSGSAFFVILTPENEASINKGTHVGQPVFSELFALFVSAGGSPPSPKKNKNPSKIQGCPMRSSSAGAEMLADKEKAAENTLCILKGFDAV